MSLTIDHLVQLIKQQDLKEIHEYFLKNPKIKGDINTLDKDGYPVLHYAFKAYADKLNSESKKIIDYLLSAGASLETQDYAGSTLLMDYAFQDSLDVVKLIIEIQKKYGSLKLEAILRQKRNHFLIGKLGNAFILAAARGNEKIVSFFLTLDILPSSEELLDAFQFACIKGMSSIVSELIRLGIKPSTTQIYNAINAASIEGHFNIIETLLNFLKQSSKEIQSILNMTHTSDKETVLFSSVKKGHYKISTLLVENGADPNIFDKNDNTILMCMVDEQDKQAVDFLLSNKSIKDSSVNKQNNSGDSALLLAAKSGNDQIVHSLISIGKAKIAICNNRKETPLLLVTNKYHGFKPKNPMGTNEEICQKIILNLIALGADPTISDLTGETPLMKASRLGLSQIVQSLLADPRCVKTINQHNSKWHTALSLASYAGANAIATEKILLQFGANPNQTPQTLMTFLFKSFQQADREAFSKLKLLPEKEIEIFQKAKVSFTKNLKWMHFFAAVLNDDVKTVAATCMEYEKEDLFLDEEVVEVFYILLEKYPHQVLEIFLKNKVFHEKLKNSGVLTDGLKSLCQELTQALLRYTQHLNAKEIKMFHSIKLLISYGADYLLRIVLKDDDKATILSELADNYASTIFLTMAQNPNIKPLFKTFAEKLQEARSRKFLAHRFALAGESKLDNISIKLEGLVDLNAIIQMRNSYREFSDSDIQSKQVLSLLAGVLDEKYSPDFQKIIADVNSALSKLATPEWENAIPDIISNKDLLLLPVRTVYPTHLNFQEENHSEGVVLFSDKMLKINRGGSTKTPGIRIYTTYNHVSNEIIDATQPLLESYQKPIYWEFWDTELDSVLAATEDTIITRKEQTAGNCTWATAKLLIYSAIYGTIYIFCKSKNIPQETANILSEKIAEKWYKLFTLDDRNRVVRNYLSKHLDNLPNYPLTLLGRVQCLENFIKAGFKSKFSVDKAMIEKIYTKSLTSLLKDLLKSQDLESARKLLKEQKDNVHWKPLLFSVRYTKNAFMTGFLVIYPEHVNARDKKGNTPLHFAAANGNIRASSCLLEFQNINKLNIRDLNAESNTAFHLAACNNHGSILELFLKKDKELLNKKGFNNESALQLACGSDSHAAVKFLLAANASLDGIIIDKNQYSAEIKKLLIEHQEKQSKKTKVPPSPLILSAPELNGLTTKTAVINNLEAQPKSCLQTTIG